MITRMSRARDRRAALLSTLLSLLLQIARYSPLIRVSADAETDAESDVDLATSARGRT